MPSNLNKAKAKKVKKEDKFLDMLSNASLQKKKRGRPKKVATQVKKYSKTFSLKGIFCIFIAVVVGVLSGFFITKSLTANDCFLMLAYENGENDICIGGEDQSQTYTELGAKCVSFNKDISEEVRVNYLYREDLSSDTISVDKIDLSISGIYYAVYTVDNIKYKTVTLTRNIIVLREEVNE